MNDLTEQWKKGELPSGEYYIVDDLGLNTTDKYFEGLGFGIEKPQSIIAPVPSYEEWQSMDRLEKIMLQERARLNKQVIELLEENTKLKELLKRARNLMNYTKDWACSDATEEMIAKINQALGEDK